MNTTQSKIAAKYDEKLAIMEDEYDGLCNTYNSICGKANSLMLEGHMILAIFKKADYADLYFKQAEKHKQFLREMMPVIDELKHQIDEIKIKKIEAVGVYNSVENC